MNEKEERCIHLLAIAIQEIIKGEYMPYRPERTINSALEELKK